MEGGGITTCAGNRQFGNSEHAVVKYNEQENFGLDFSVRPFNPEDFESIDSMSQMVE